MSEQSISIVRQLTLEEKLHLITGKDTWHTYPIERLGIPSIMLADGPHGLRKQTGGADALGIGGSNTSVCFPCACGTAASFHRALLADMGKTLGAECRAENLAVLLGPGVNIKRSPLCGRNFEYFSEDPYLSSELAVSYTQGVQSQGVGVSVKHYAANNQEKRRMTVRSVVDERALREIYLPSFEQTVKRAGPWTVMAAYNRLFEGIYCSENKRLLTDILRREWDFQGLVVSDWGAVSNRGKGVAAGLDLEMPGSYGFHNENLLAALESGELEMSALDTACERVIDLVLRAVEGAGEGPAPALDWAADHEASRAVARESMVLLKNNGTLPLKKEQKVAFLGGFARQPRYQGSGSSHINPWHVSSALEAASDREGLDVEYAEGFGVRDLMYNPVLAEQAIALAKRCDTAVIFAGLPDSFETEGSDRRHLDLPSCQNDFIAAVAKVQPNVVVVLHNGAPVRMPWIDDVSAVLESYLGGEAVGEAQLDLLFGDYSPSGRLAETFPLRLEDTPCYDFFPGNPLTVEYRESIYVGYRYYDKAEKEVLFPFGHGLTYTSFEYSDLKLSAKRITPASSLKISLTVKNTGDFDAYEVVQLYVAPPETDVFRAAKELKGFEKVFVKAGEEAQVSFVLDAAAFAFYHTGLADWYCESGSYRILAAASSRDIRLAAAVKLQNTVQAPAIYTGALPAYQSGEVQQAPAEEFEALLGFPLPPTHPQLPQRLGLDHTIEDARQGRPGRFLYKAVKGVMPLVAKKMEGLGDTEALIDSVFEMPVRTIALWSGGMLTADMAEALVSIFNEEKYLRSIYTLLKGGAKAVKKLVCKEEL
ncbi:MAG: glycoside hydrolase family 3 C-terminal domain-containing protein [Oscillospiraceae bacterium]|nr:glycoside hydrolase family 3 C-terminal domain-containing protein [Oscillospiraceae bacterium]